MPLAAALVVASVAAASSPTVVVQPGTAKPGDPVLVTVRGVEEQPSGSLGGRALAFYPYGGGFQALAPLSVDLPLGDLPLSLDLPDGGEGWVGTVSVVDPQYPARELSVNKKFIDPPKKVKAWIAEDKKAFAKAFSKPFSPLAVPGDFTLPRRAVVTANFGDRRLFNGKQQSQHYGTDLDGNIGEPIFAANDGEVVMARSCYTSGNTVVLHHGAELYTLYFHLSAFDVKPGERVKRGQLLGKVGKTGRVTGPHLHFSAKVAGLYVDPMSLLKLDFTP